MSHRVVIDSNVYISASFSRHSLVGKVLEYIWNHEGFEIFHSPETFYELQIRIQKPKFDRYVTSELRRIFIQKVKQQSTFVEVMQKVALYRDQADNKFLALAATAKVDFLITGDKDLLILEQYQQTKIITPRDFLDYFHKNTL